MNLSKASGLVLIADKTEILHERGQQYEVNYLWQRYFINGEIEVKIDAVYFNKSIIDMRERQITYIFVIKFLNLSKAGKIDNYHCREKS
jgi:hypothetical protein